MEGIQNSVMGSSTAGANHFAPDYEDETAVTRSLPPDGSCGVCQKPDATRSCTGCGKVAYCSRGCQRTAWKSHKAVCGKQ